MNGYLYVVIRRYGDRERSRTTVETGEAGGDRIKFVKIEMEPRSGAVPV